VSLSSYDNCNSLCSLFVIPTRSGTGASIISINGCGSTGTIAKHHLKGYKRQFKPKMAEDIRLALPTKIIDFSNKTAESS